MWTAEAVVRALRTRGELWEAAPGLVGLRGDALALYRAIERAVADLVRTTGADEWRPPAGIALETLDRADYFASFPQWLTAAAHLSDDAAALERVASSADPAAAARAELAPADAALAPALCYHAYPAIAGGAVDGPVLATLQGTCWRHEGARLAPLERGWAFTMREVVCIGAAAEVEAFRSRWIDRARALAAALGLEVAAEPASDPFFAPTARGKALLQRVKALKHELVFRLPEGRPLAVASFNHHERFFGEAFGIRLADGSPASSGCVAFGLERWLLAFLAAHGPEPDAWPEIEITTRSEVRS